MRCRCSTYSAHTASGSSEAARWKYLMLRPATHIMARGGASGLHRALHMTQLRLTSTLSSTPRIMVSLRSSTTTSRPTRLDKSDASPRARIQLFGTQSGAAGDVPSNGGPKEVAPPVEFCGALQEGRSSSLPPSQAGHAGTPVLRLLPRCWCQPSRRISAPTACSSAPSRAWVRDLFSFFLLFALLMAIG